MSFQKAEELLRKYKAGTCSTEEKILVERWYLEQSALQPIPEGPADPLSEEMLIWNRIEAAVPAPSLGTNKIYRLRWLAAAASLLIVLSLGIYFYRQNYAASQLTRLQIADILPDNGNKAWLTLANGKRIALDQASAGELATEDGVKISKTKDGNLVYQAQIQTGQQSNIEYNTISIPRGGQHHVVLPDGTGVWLNAASTLRYPTRFLPDRREVELDGEGYFEVAKLSKAGKDQTQERIPFTVKTGNQMVEVLGTHFNINAYMDEGNIKTTLLEGSVKVEYLKTHESKLIHPGEQALTTTGNSAQFRVASVDVEQVVAWKSGFFEFDDIDIQLVLKQISRFYNIDIEYQGKPPALKLGGRISRNLPLSVVLKSLEPDLKFRISGRKLLVIP